jgi:hypothetical protein
MSYEMTSAISQSKVGQGRAPVDRSRDPGSRRGRASDLAIVLGNVIVAAAWERAIQGASETVWGPGQVHRYHSTHSPY